MTLHETVVDGVATITMDNPPVNALGVADTYGLATMLDSYRMRTDIPVSYTHLTLPTNREV